jgi:imidazolonepropionase-like amidohydrolase
MDDMKKRSHLISIALALMLFLALPFLAQDRGSDSSADNTNMLAFTNVTVIDVVEGVAKPDMAVIVTGENITAVGTTDEIEVPNGATIVDGTGKYLIPGLWDMHTHNTWNSFNLFIANGITGVREMGISRLPLPEILALRKKVQNGELIGPRFVAAGPTVNAVQSSNMYVVSALTAERGRFVVDSLAAAGADFIKVYHLDRDTFFAIAEAANEIGIPFDGHLSRKITLKEAAIAGQRSIEHYTTSHPRGLMTLCSSQPDLLAGAVEDLNNLNALPRDSIHLAHRRGIMEITIDSYDDERCRKELEKLGEFATWHTPTLTMGMGRRDIFDDRVMQDPRFRYISPQQQAHFQRIRSIYISSLSEREVAEYQHVIDRIIVNLQKGNVGLLAGADVSDGHGFALHGELESLVSAGLTPAEVLRAATINPVLYLEREDVLGTIEAGKLADLVLLDANPLEGITNTQKIRAVVANGRYFDREALDELLKEAERAAKDENND